MDKKVYVGGLGDNTQKEELEDLFNKFGDIESVWVARKPTGFGFVTFKTLESAEDAIRDMNGFDFHGTPLKVEMAKSDGRRNRETRTGGERRYNDDRGRRNYDDDRRPRDDYHREPRAYPEYDRQEYRRDDYRREEPAPRYDDRSRYEARPPAYNNEYRRSPPAYRGRSRSAERGARRY